MTKMAPVEPLSSTIFPSMLCRKCGGLNPLVYFAPVSSEEDSTCICFKCAGDRSWLDHDGNLKPDVSL